MICVECQGAGEVHYYSRDLQRYGGAWLTQMKPCPRCGGFGVVHCCEGDREQPSPAVPDVSSEA